jgi:hypothetical protein
MNFMGEAERKFAQALLIIFGVCMTVAPVCAQTTHRSLSSDTAEPYSPGFPFLPESDPLMELPEREEPSAVILNDLDAFFEWDQRAFRIDPVPTDFNRAEGLLLPSTTPHLPLPSSPIANEEEMQLRDKELSTFENAFKSSRILGIYRPPSIRITPFVPEPRIVFLKQSSRRYAMGPVRVGFEAEQSFNVANNVFGAKRDTKSDTFITFQPRFYAEAGTRGFASLLYMPNFTRYSTYRYLDSRDENVVFNFRYKFTKLEIGSDLAYLTQSGLFVDAEGYSKARSYLANVFGNYPITRKIGLSFAYEGRNDMADPGGIAIEHAGMLSARYQLSEPISFGGSYQLGHVESDFGDQIYHTHQVIATLRPSYHFKLDGRGGFQVRHFSKPVAGKEALASPVFDLTGSYHWNDNTAFVLRLYRSITTVAFDNLHLQVETAMESYALVRFFGNTDIKAQIVGGYAERIANVAPETGDFCFLQGGISVSWAVNRICELTIYNTTMQRFADSANRNFISNVTGVSCKLRF